LTIESTLFAAGSGGIIGFLIGFAIKRVLKIMAVVVGLFFGVLIYLQSQSIINVNWDKLQSVSESTLSVVTNSITNSGQISIISTNLGIPLTGGLSAGLLLGFTKG
jgi:uncharacterized membrane protein (Fun14 family)